MKRLKSALRIMAVVCAAFGWWGLLYPGLTLTPDTVRAVRAEAGGAALPQDYDGKLFWSLLKAEPGEIRLRSRLLEDLNAFWEAHSWEKSTEN